MSCKAAEAERVPLSLSPAHPQLIYTLRTRCLTHPLPQISSPQARAGPPQIIRFRVQGSGHRVYPGEEVARPVKQVRLSGSADDLRRASESLWYRGWMLEV